MIVNKKIGYSALLGIFVVLVWALYGGLLASKCPQKCTKNDNPIATTTPITSIAKSEQLIPLSETFLNIPTQELIISGALPIEGTEITHEPKMALDHNDSQKESTEKNNEFYTTWATQEEAALWDLLEQNGLCQQEFQQLQKQHLDSYYDQRALYAHHIPKGPHLSEQTLIMVHDILDDFNIPLDQIGIISYIDHNNCPAHTDDINLFIDESLLLTYTSYAQRFIIAHELQHFLHNDDSYCYIARKVLDQSKNADTPYNILNRFQEMRADLGAITKSPIYLQGQQEFLEQVVKKYGQGAGITHPKIATRMDLGKEVLAFNAKESYNTVIL